MTQQTTVAPVQRSVTVAAPPERAFEVFTAGFASWWPSSHSVIEGGYEGAYIEPREGGRWYERSTTGVEETWGYVLAYEPPSRLVLSWMLDGEFEVDEDRSRETEIEIRFLAEGDGTRVELEHRGFDRRADGAAIAREVGADGGWGGLLQRYAEVAAAP
jgi:uncharacterized protein YndB with AHSA1/START domain